jgi:cholesterol oxidase
MSATLEIYDAVIVGSGFGGSIAALRFAESGKSVLVLERGRRWHPGEFPRDLRKTDEVLWRYPRKSSAQGLYDVRFLKGAGTVSASGVGGGSLIYANIHIRPDETVFDDPRWPTGINRQTLAPYYDRVAKMLNVQPLPSDIVLPKRDMFRSAAQKIGQPIFDPDQAVSWKEPGGPGRKACQLCAECEFGCQHGAKNTLDFTYLARAEQLGAQIRPGCMVTHISPDNGGGYRVHGVTTATGESIAFRGRRVVLSAGTLGTNEILFRSRDQNKTLPQVSRQLGIGYSGNGDYLGNLQNSATDLASWNGPDVTSVMLFPDSSTPFTMAAPTFNKSVMKALTGMGQPQVAWLRPLGFLIWPALNWLLPLAFSRGWLNRAPRNPGQPARMTNLFAIGRDNAGGKLTYKYGQLQLHWNYAAENAPLIARMEEAMRRTSEAYGGSFAPLVTWALCRKIITVHSLGGCRLATSIEQGVVSPEGEVFGYPGLFIADGSVIPTAIGFHPVMTISAVSERIADAAVASLP